MARKKKKQPEGEETAKKPKSIAKNPAASLALCSAHGDAAAAGRLT